HRVPECMELALEWKPIPAVVRPHELFDEQTVGESSPKPVKRPTRVRRTRRSAAQEFAAVSDDQHAPPAEAIDRTNDKLRRQRVERNALRRSSEPVQGGHATAVLDRVLPTVPFVDQRTRPGVAASPCFVGIAAGSPRDALRKTMEDSGVARAPPFGPPPLDSL